MLIKKIHIQSFGSLRDISLDELGNFIVLLGMNGAGKTFLFELLHHFFNEFKAIGGESSISNNDYMWHGRITEEPIRVDITLQLRNGEINKVFALPEKVLNAVKKECSKEAFNRVEVSRSLTFNGNWKTELIKWADIEIVNDDKLVSSEKFADLARAIKPLENYQFAFFTPEHSADNIGGDRLLLDVANKVAYSSSDEIDALVSKDIIKGIKIYAVPEDQQVTDWRTWSANQGYNVIERPPHS